MFSKFFVIQLYALPGTGLLCGWFGFNAGSALERAIAVQALGTTTVAAAAGMVWY
jgi:ammonia channel protein AmtB